MVTIEEYFRYAIKNKLLIDLKFYYSTMTIPLQNKNDYFKIENNKYYVLMDNKYEEVQGKTKDMPLLHYRDKITLFNADMKCIESTVHTTIGRAIVNYILLEYNFKGKISYMDKQLACNPIEKVIEEALKKDVITVEEYTNFVDASNMLQALSRITTISATAKTMTAPPGIEKIKKDLIEEYNKKYGKKWVKDSIRVIEFGEELKKVDTEYMKDDPTYGKLTSGKVADNARPKMYLSFGSDAGFGDATDDPNVVFNSLLEGFPKDIEQLTIMFNSSRAASFSRGSETQDGGVAAKTFLRATASTTIEEGDCGSDLYKKLLVNKDIAKTLEGRYILEGNKLVMITDPTKYIGKEIKMRSPMYCKLGGKTYCSVCCGSRLIDYKKGITSLATDISAALLTASLKKMHSSVKHLVKADITTMVN